jgi:protein SCO1/2
VQPELKMPNGGIRWEVRMVFFALLLAAGTGLFLVFDQLTAPFTAAPPSIVEVAEGGVSWLIPPRPLADFTLTAQNNTPARLSDWRGKSVLMAFGYTHCPDVCPLTLGEFDQIRAALGADAEQVRFVFVSVDGERDTPDSLTHYLGVRGVESFVTALTGNAGELRRMGVDYGLYFEKRVDTGTAANYLIDHTASTFLIDADGRLAAIFAFGTDDALITAAILQGQ